MEKLSKKNPNMHTARLGLVRAYEREATHGGDWEVYRIDPADPPEAPCAFHYARCVVDWWDIWDDCTPPATDEYHVCPIF